MEEGVSWEISLRKKKILANPLLEVKCQFTCPPKQPIMKINFFNYVFEGGIFRLF